MRLPSCVASKSETGRRCSTRPNLRPTSKPGAEESFFKSHSCTFMSTDFYRIESKADRNEVEHKRCKKPRNTAAVPAYRTKTTNTTNNSIIITISFFLLLFLNPDLSIGTSIRINFLLETEKKVCNPLWIRISAEGFKCKSIFKYIPNDCVALRQTFLNSKMPSVLWK